MRIDHVSQPYRVEVAKKKASTTQKGSDKAPVNGGENVQLSENAKTLSNTQASIDVAKAKIANTSDIRAEKVQEVKNKIEEGYYNSPEFAERLADKLIKDIGKDLGIS